MKKMFLSAFALSLLCAAPVFGQAPAESGIVRVPSKANGYLILNYEAYPTVNRWEVLVIQKVYNATENRWEEQILKRTNLYNTFWIKLPGTYNTSAHMIRVTGYDEANTVIVEDTKAMIQGEAPGVETEWVCNGSDYVYALQYYPAVGSFNAEVRMGMPFLTTPPYGFDRYYEWFEGADFHDPYLGPQDEEGHGLTSFSYDGLNVVDQKIVRLENIPEYSTLYHNRFGDAISGTIYGVQKYYGDYVNDYMEIESGALADDPSSLTFPFVMELVNNNVNNPVAIDCDASFSNGGIPPGENPGSQSNEPCIETYYETLGTAAYSHDGGYTYTVFTVVQLFTLPCFTDPVVGTPGGGFPVGQTGFSWPADLSVVTIHPIGPKAGASITLKYSDFYDENGTFIGTPITLPAGLLMVGYQFSDASYRAAYVYNKEESTVRFAQSDFVSYTAYPVPITGDDFHLQVEATERVSFTYMVRDVDGNVLFSDNYELEKGTALDRVIEPRGGIPVGMLFNTLTFGDGSQINFQTIK
jgi:hypothetical protein